MSNKPEKAGPYICGYLFLVGLFLILFVAGGLILSSKNLLGLKYEAYSFSIGLSLIFAGLGVLVASVKFLIWGKRRMAANLDVMLDSLGLRAEQYRTDGRHYFGRTDSRQIDIYCFPAKKRSYFGNLKTVKYTGHSVELVVAADLHTRCCFARIEKGERIQDAIRTGLINYLSENFVEKYGGEIIKLDDAAFRDFQVYALDKGWMQNLLTLPEAQSAIKSVLGENEKFARQQLHLKPDSVSVSVFCDIRRFKPGDMERLAANTLKIAAIAESIAEKTC